MTAPRRVAHLGILVLVLASPAAGQQTYRQTVVVTAAATPVELGSATRMPTIITREQIAVLPVHTIADVIRLAASVDVRARGVRGVQTDFVVRGAGFGQMLVLVDGVRLNDAQSGHHNGDIPVPLEDVERIEVLRGPGSSLFGADAFGGTVNVITRRGAARSWLALEGGSFDLVGGRGRTGLERGHVSQTVSASFNRSSGFMFDRDFRTAIVRSSTSFGDRSRLSVSYLSNEFGANNFYGMAPSREWTSQLLTAVDHRFGGTGGWSGEARGSYRTHGDHFVWDQFRPALSDNRHRTHAALGSLTASRRIGDGASFTAGMESGNEWIRSTNLGDHATFRVSGFGEWRQDLGRRTQIDATMRVDRYDEFGTSWSPSAGIGWWAMPALRVRASAGRAFRIPTFTERYYSDPAHLARAQVGPETSWAGEAGADAFLSSGWLLGVTVFGRSDEDVIDWLRPTATDLWRTHNIRDVDTVGVELGVQKTFAGGIFVLAEYAALDMNAPAVSQLSKYVLDFAPHSVTAAASVPLPAGFRVSPRLEYRHRSRPSGARKYVLLDARIARQIGRQFRLVVDGTNLLDQTYEEIAGVAMPGAAVAVSVAVATR